MEDSTISVVIPTYNGSAFIPETLRSVFAQTQPPNEIIVVDDCSTDDTVDLILSLRTESPCPIRLIRMECNSGGPAAPLNRGIAEATGEFIALLDQDDLFASRRLELSHDVLAGNESCGLSLGRFTTFQEGSKASNPLNEKVVSTLPARVEFLSGAAWRTRLFSDSSIQQSCSNHFFRKSVWQAVGGYRADAGAAADFAFVMRCFDYGIALLPDVLFHKRVHESNTWNSGREQTLAMLNLREQVAREQNSRELFAALAQLTVAASQRFRWLGDHETARVIASRLVKLGHPVTAAREFAKSVVSQFVGTLQIN